MILYVIVPKLVMYVEGQENQPQNKNKIFPQLADILANIKANPVLLAFSDKERAKSYTTQLAGFDDYQGSPTFNMHFEFSIATVLVDSAKIKIKKVRLDECSQLKLFFNHSQIGIKTSISFYHDWYASNLFSVIAGKDIEYVISTEIGECIFSPRECHLEYNQRTTTEQKLNTYKRGYFGFGLTRMHKDEASYLENLNQPATFCEFFGKVKEYTDEKRISSQPKSNFYAMLRAILIDVYVNEEKSTQKLVNSALFFLIPSALIKIINEYQAPLPWVSSMQFECGGYFGFQFPIKEEHEEYKKILADKDGYTKRRTMQMLGSIFSKPITQIIVDYNEAEKNSQQLDTLALLQGDVIFR